MPHKEKRKTIDLQSSKNLEGKKERDVVRERLRSGEKVTDYKPKERATRRTKERLSLSERKKRNRELAGEGKETIQLNQPQAQPPEDESFLQRQIRERPVTAGLATGAAVFGLGAAAVAAGTTAVATGAMVGARALATKLGIKGADRAGQVFIARSKAGRVYMSSKKINKVGAKDLGIKTGSRKMGSKIELTGRFAENVKTLEQTRGVWGKVFTKVKVRNVATEKGIRATAEIRPRYLSIGALTTLAISAIGSYPFTGFLREESLQTLSIPIMTALDQGDLQGASELVEANDAVIEGTKNMVGYVPWGNSIKALQEFQDSAGKANNQWKRIIDERRGEIEFEQPSISEEISARDERKRAEQEERDVAFQEAQEKRDLGDRQDSAYFEVTKQLKERPIEEIDPEIVDLARESNLFLDQF